MIFFFARLNLAEHMLVLQPGYTQEWRTDAVFEAILLLQFTLISGVASVAQGSGGGHRTGE